jgi:hypothetical protein
MYISDHRDTPFTCIRIHVCTLCLVMHACTPNEYYYYYQSQNTTIEFHFHKTRRSVTDVKWMEKRTIKIAGFSPLSEHAIVNTSEKQCKSVIFVNILFTVPIVLHSRFILKIKENVIIYLSFCRLLILIVYIQNSHCRCAFVQYSHVYFAIVFL